MARLSPRDEAKLKRYEELFAREPTALVFAGLASFYARKLDFRRAIDVLRQGLGTFPNYFSARILLARCYLGLDQFDAARAELDKVLATDPYNISALGVLADELRNRGYFADARENYLKILEFEPDNEEYRNKLELLEKLTEGSRLGGRPAATVVGVPPEAARPASAARAAKVEAGLAAAGEGERPSAEDLATLTLAKIYEDQGLFVRAREIVEKVITREPNNQAAREAYEHVNKLIASEASPDGSSIIQLIKKVEAVTGLLEHDEMELWQEVAAGVEEALVGFEEITLAQAIAAAVGLTSFDDFTVPGHESAVWELDLSAAAGTTGVAGADELEVELPIALPLESPMGVSVYRSAVAARPGAVGTDEFELATAGGPGFGGAAAEKDFVMDLKAEITTRREAGGVAPGGRRPVEAPEEVSGDLTVRPDHYQRRELLAPDGGFVKEDDDFLTWRDSIKLKEI